MYDILVNGKTFKPIVGGWKQIPGADYIKQRISVPVVLTTKSGKKINQTLMIDSQISRYALHASVMGENVKDHQTNDAIRKLALELEDIVGRRTGFRNCSGYFTVKSVDPVKETKKSNKRKTV